MGSYTEVYVNVDLIEDLPDNVLAILTAIVAGDGPAVEALGAPRGWALLFGNGSFYTPNTRVASLTYCDTAEHWSLIGKGDLKDYDYIVPFFDWLRPYTEDKCEGSFIGYHRYEDAVYPTLVFNHCPDVAFDESTGMLNTELHTLPMAE